MSDTLGQRLAQARNTAGLSQAQAAKSIDAPISVIQGLEAGVPDYTGYLPFLADLYRVDRDWLETGQERDVALPVANFDEADREMMRSFWARRRRED